MSTTEENKRIYREFLEVVFNRHQPGALDRYLTEDFVRHGVSGHDDISGREAYKRWAVEFLAAFPDCHNETLDLIAEGDRVVQRYRFTATHRGPYGGLAATGRRISVVGIEIARMVGGRVAEGWACPDTLGMMQQLGVVQMARPAA